jgi:hypothetical protein
VALLIGAAVPGARLATAGAHSDAPNRTIARASGRAPATAAPIVSVAARPAALIAAPPAALIAAPPAAPIAATPDRQVLEGRAALGGAPAIDSPTPAGLHPRRDAGAGQLRRSVVTPVAAGTAGAAAATKRPHVTLRTLSDS